MEYCPILAFHSGVSFKYGLRFHPVFTSTAVTSLLDFLVTELSTFSLRDPVGLEESGKSQQFLLKGLKI